MSQFYLVYWTIGLTDWFETYSYLLISTNSSKHTVSYTYGMDFYKSYVLSIPGEYVKFLKSMTMVLVS